VINLRTYRDRVIRDKRYKLYVENDRSSVKLVDLKEDPDEFTNRLDDPELIEVRKQLEAVEKSFPPQDASPRYTPLPPQKWDLVQKNPGQREGLTGLPSNRRTKNKKK
jgi:hypothetical protein